MSIIKMIDYLISGLVPSYGSEPRFSHPSWTSVVRPTRRGSYQSLSLLRNGLCPLLPCLGLQLTKKISNTVPTQNCQPLDQQKSS